MVDILKHTRVVQDFPKPGIGFFDITTVLKDEKVFGNVIDAFAEHYENLDFDIIAGIESRGFILGSAIAHSMHKGLVLVRKSGKLPAATYKEEYDLEYGTDCVEVHKDAIKTGTKVLVIDDLLATGGTAKATCNLIEKAGGKVAGLGFMIELDFLKGREKIANYDIFSMAHVSGE